MLEELGLDPLKDIDRVTIGSWGKGPEDMKRSCVVRGKFDPEKLFKAAKEAGQGRTATRSPSSRRASTSW